MDFRFLLPHLLALPTEAWRGVEIRRRLAENGYFNLPGPNLQRVLRNKVTFDYAGQTLRLFALMHKL